MISALPSDIRIPAFSFSCSARNTDVHLWSIETDFMLPIHQIYDTLNLFHYNLRSSGRITFTQLCHCYLQIEKDLSSPITCKWTVSHVGFSITLREHHMPLKVPKIEDSYISTRCSATTHSICPVNGNISYGRIVSTRYALQNHFKSLANVCGLHET